MLYYGFTCRVPASCWCPFLLCFLLGVAALGVGTLLAGLTVYYRDFRYVVPYLVQLWMFATPSVYMQPPVRWPGLWASSTPKRSTPGLMRLSARSARAVLGEPILWGSLVIAGALVACVSISSPDACTSAGSRTSSRILSETRLTQGARRTSIER